MSHSFVHRMIKLYLTDGEQDISAIEYKPMRNLSCDITPGCKVLLKGCYLILLLNIGKRSISSLPASHRAERLFEQLKEVHSLKIISISQSKLKINKTLKQSNQIKFSYLQIVTSRGNK